MSTLLYIVGGIALILALLVARGMYLLGRDTEVEQAARARSSGGVSSSGWLLLDRLQTGNVPIVSSIEARLGWDRDGDEDDQEADE